MDMNPSDLMNELQRMSRFFMAFKQAEMVVSELAAIEQRKRNAEQAIADAEIKVKATVASVAGIVAGHEKKAAILAQQNAQNEKDMLDARAFAEREANAQIDVAVGKAKALIGEAQEDAAAVRKATDNARVDLEQVTKEVTEARAQLAELKAQRAAILQAAKAMLG